MTNEADFVPVVYARNMSEAEYYREMLEDHDMNAQIVEDIETPLDVSEGPRGIPVMVPHEQLEEAELIIEQRSSFDDEFDEDYDPLDSDNDEDELDGFDELDTQTIDGSGDDEEIF